MDPHFHGLPPLKRFRLMQQQQSQHRPDVVLPILPAKKRKETREKPILPGPTPAAFAVSTYSLPAKKRVWALPPDLVPEKPVSELDLNLEYKPDLGEESEAAVGKLEECTEGVCENASEKSPEDSGGEEECEDEDGIVCDVCKSTDGDPSDPIVFCDGCDLMVHATCYGNPLIKGIPEGDWFCSQCSGSSEASQSNESFSCCLCPGKGGAMKPTGDGRWAHIVCALYVPEVFFKDPEGREGIDCSKVPKRRWKERCYVCKSASGCAIQCSEIKCPLAFHVTCGLNEDLCIEYREGRKGDIVAGFCRTHTDLWEKQQESGKFKIVARKD
ncbi:putative chromatin regulator PHD family [Rosa chinensis]|uniref:Putative chromatin regulator PHD family n=1 Tax=Rosa chinensis TaxID=74649 RepID=A0A2P6Q9K7_ROSCH|nr:protein Jade-1 [Rosa chinensis]PRQ30868.1 putative chromatin regulator PHD family [Rosa chinensis]